MAAKKEVDYRIARSKGAELLKKQLAERKGKPIVLPSKENRKNLKDLGVLVASLTVPALGAAVKGARVAKLTQTAIKSKKPYVKVTTGTQAKNANITLKTPGAKKAGSPKPGTKAKIQRVVNPRQGEAGQISVAKNVATKKAKAKLTAPALLVAGYQTRVEQEKAKAKNNKKK
jgi:hypothetical protein